MSGVRREVAYTESDYGVWSIQCAACPLRPHLDALGLDDKGCAGGIATNMQGHITLHNCEHFGGTGTLHSDADNKLTGECRHGEQKP